LDKLRKSINVVWIFTTNLLEDLDPAFVDRCVSADLDTTEG
jgi:hypothetical protein